MRKEIVCWFREEGEEEGKEARGRREAARIGNNHSRWMLMRSRSREDHLFAPFLPG